VVQILPQSALLPSTHEFLIPQHLSLSTRSQFSANGFRRQNAGDGPVTTFSVSSETGINVRLRSIEGKLRAIHWEGQTRKYQNTSWVLKEFYLFVRDRGAPIDVGLKKAWPLSFSEPPFSRVNQAIWYFYIRKYFGMIGPRSLPWSAERLSGKTCFSKLLEELRDTATGGSTWTHEMDPLEKDDSALVSWRE
jgi:hypothetical protein